MRLIILLLATISLAARAAEPVFTPVGLSVNGPFSGQSFEFEPVGYKGGTTVNIYCEAKGLISIDNEASTIAVFADDSGKDLLKSQDGKESAKLGPFPKINASGTAALFDVSSPELPGKTARFVTLSGKLLIKTATTRDKTENKHVSLAKGTKLAWGPKQFVVDEVSKEGVLTLSLKTEDAVENLAEISVTDAAGKRTVAVCRMSSTMEIGGKHLSTLAYEIETTGDAFDVTLAFWKDIKTVEVPFAVKLGIGL